MRFLMVSASFPPQVGGLEVLLADTANGLRRRGHEVCVLTALRRDGRSSPAACVLPRLEHVSMDDYGSLRPRSVARHFRRRASVRANLRVVAELARSFAPDLIVTWQLAGIGFELPAHLSRLELPLVVFLSDSLPIAIERRTRQGSRWRARLRRLLYGIDLTALFRTGLIACSATLKSAYVDAGFSAAQISVLHPAVSPSCIAAEPRIGSGKHLLFCGRLFAQKGAHLAIEALARLRDDGGEDYRLDIVGPLSGEASDRDYVARLRALVDRTHLTAAVRFLGARTRDEVVQLYGDCDTVLFPSAGEPFGLVVIEAMSQGVPVIAVADGGPCEIISHMNDGVLVEADAGAMADAIRLLASDPTLRRSMGEAAIRKVRALFTLDTYLDRLESHAERIQTSSRSRTSRKGR